MRQPRESKGGCRGVKEKSASGRSKNYRKLVTVVWTAELTAKHQLPSEIATSSQSHNSVISEPTDMIHIFLDSVLLTVSADIIDFAL